MGNQIPENKIIDHIDAFFDVLEEVVQIQVKLSVEEEPDCSVYLKKEEEWGHKKIKCLAFAVDNIGRNHVLMPDGEVVCFTGDQVL